MVDFGTEEGHGTSRPEGTGRDIAGDEAIRGAEDSGGHAEGEGDVGRTHGHPLRRGEVNSQVGGGEGVVLAKMQNTPGESGNGAIMRVTPAAEAHNFAPNAILLSGEFKSGEGGGLVAHYCQ